MSKDFSFAKGIDQIKKLHGGVYWNKVAETNKYTDKDEGHAKAAIKLVNMLQYIGALNEAQLRNMRLVVDTTIMVLMLQKLVIYWKVHQLNKLEIIWLKLSLGIGDITS